MTEHLITISHVLALGMVALPALSALLIGLRMLVREAPSERTTAFIAGFGALTSLLTSLALLVSSTAGEPPMTLDYGALFRVDGYEFRLALLIDRLSLVMLVLSSAIVGLVSRFSVRYLHREAGFHRFFLLLSAFSAGMNLLVSSGSYDILFAGWEVVGIASMLLIAFFNQRRGAVSGAMRAMISYRVADVGLLVAGIMLHEFFGSAEFEAAFSAENLASGRVPSHAATWIVLALLLSVMGKSAQFPLSGWLPRAMEGPTPSSALFYGALSVHAGVYLLLRSAPLIERSPAASIAIGVVGALSALLATLSGRTQTDAKSILAYATITQVGLMLLAMAFHLWTWVLVHLVAHALLRLFQLLRAPSALRDAQELTAALRRFPRPRKGVGMHILPTPFLNKLYFLARQRFFVDTWLERLTIEPLMAVARTLDKLERLAVDGPGDIAEPLAADVSGAPLQRGTP